MENEADQQNEPIEAFLERLKLADKYAELFVSNGFATVEDCRGLTEDSLKDIGVTLPGHYRRILSKLPGCSISKPPRTRLSQNNALPVVIDPIETPDQIDYEPEDVYLLEEGNPLEQSSLSNCEEALTPPVSETGAPKKPQRSIDRSQLSPVRTELPQNQEENVYNHLNETPKVPKSPSTLGEAVFHVLRDSPLDTPTLLSSEEDSDEDPETVHVPDLRIACPDASPLKEQNDAVAVSSPQQDVLSPDFGVSHMCLPSPPPPVWMSGDEGGFPSPPPPQSTVDPAVECEYDRLNLTSRLHEPQASEDPAAAYEMLHESVPDVSKHRKRLPAYEEVDHVSEPKAAEPKSWDNSDHSGPASPEMTYSVAQYAQAEDKKEGKENVQSSKENDTKGRSRTFDAYNVAAEDEEEGVYAVCGDGGGGGPNSMSFESSSALFLPRSSGSLPASVLQLSRNPALKSRSHRFTTGDASEDSCDDTLDEQSEGGDEDAVYQSIKEVSHPAFTPKTKGESGTSIRRKTPYLRVGRKKKTSRPLSAFVDSFKFGRQSIDEADVSEVDLSSHARSLSTSDRKQGMDLVDVKIPEEGKAKSHDIAQLSPMHTKKTRSGWLMKHGWHEGRAPLRRRWVVFDGDELAYYENDKTDLSKGIIPLEMILRVQALQSDPKIFHILTKGGRKYVFSAETSDDSSLWSSTLVAAKMFFDKQNTGQFKPGGSMYMPYKEGFLKMDGSRQKSYLATKGDQLAYYKSNNEFMFGQPVAKLSMKLASVKEIDKKKFQVVFPFKTFTFTADSEDEKRSWIEALADAVSEALSDYKVVNEVWSVPENRKCADCGREDPDWASINLAIVICKHCAGVHRDLGVHNSKVRSLKMDVKIWNDNMKMLFLASGNAVANNFWARNLPPGEAISDMADKKQRAWHITSKYMEMQYAEVHKSSGDQLALNEALTNSIRQNNIPETYSLVFSGADPNCDTGLDDAKKTPYKLAQYLGTSYTAITEFLRQNGATEEVSPEGHVTNRSTNVQKKDSITRSRAKPPVTLRDCLWKYGGDFKSAGKEQKSSKFGLISNALQPGDFQKRLCVLENNQLKYYDSEKTTVLKDDVDCAELISIGICQPEQATKSGFQFCFEVGRTTGRTYLFCADRKETYTKWTRGLLQAILPPHVQNALKQEFDYDRVGKVWIKTQFWAKKTSEWTATWCRLKGKNLYYFHQDSRTMERIDLRKLVQVGLDHTNDGTGISVSPSSSVPVFMLVFKEKTYYFHSNTRPDTESWLAAIKKADGDCGPNLEDQQLTSEGVPIILEKCMTYIEQYGLKTRGIYRLSGTHSRTTQLLSDFKQNARDTPMREGELNVHDVANALKRWFKSLPGSLLTEQLHNQWIETTQIKEEHHDRKLEWYKHLVDKLPDINRNTLKHVLIHLNNVASHGSENEMSIHNLAIVFGPTLMESQQDDGAQFIGQTSLEIGCIEDLIQNYGWLFDVTEVDREKERLMLEAKGKISQATQQQNMLTTLDYDMMVPIYLNSKEEKCVNYRVNLTAGDLVKRICKAHGFPAKTWGLYEVILDGDAERALHHSEHVLSVIKSWEMPSTNYLVAKHDYIRDKMRWLQQSKAPELKILCENQLKMLETRKKWIKVNSSLRIVDNELTMHYVKSTEGAVRDMNPSTWRKRSSKQQRNVSLYDEKTKGSTTIPLSHYHIYHGLDRKAKPPVTRKCGFTLAARNEVTRQFCTENESIVFRWIGHVIMHKFPQGITPPDSPKVETPKEETPPRRTSDSGSRRPNVLSQQDLGEAVREAALRRQSSIGSDDASRDPNPASPGFDNEMEHVDEDGTAPVPAPRGMGNVQRNPSFESGARRSMLRSPAPEGQRAVLGIRLQSELSSVLKKRTLD